MKYREDLKSVQFANHNFDLFMDNLIRKVKILKSELETMRNNFEMKVPENTLNLTEKYFLMIV
jgi:hypothetical protein